MSKLRLESLLSEHFGFAEFRPGQREAIEALLDERRLVCIQPTGHGKSLLYQLPALLVDGMTLVISPLLALMRDQIGQLDERFTIPAAAINSDQEDEENDRVRRDAREGRLRILFVAPEQLDNLATYQFLGELPIDLLVVDEAHCISTWGHDFRPSYRQIVHAVRGLEAARPELKLLALTATADQRTAADIVEQLRGADGTSATIHRAPMDRPNIALRVLPVKGLDDKLAVLSRMFEQLEGCGILYCATREQTELVAGYLSANGHDVVAYHAGLSPNAKRDLQAAYTNGKSRVIAATNALGMGIDKSDIRFIVHVDVPGSITAYYQEVGRAGRDGQPAVGVLLFDERDRKIQEHFIRSAQPDRDDFERVLTAIDNAGEESPTRTGVGVRCGLHPTKVVVVLAELVEQGFVEKILDKRRQVYVRTSKVGFPDLGRYERQMEVRTAELEAMLRYGRREVECLMRELRLALGDDGAEHCARCSVCRPESHDAVEPGDDERAAARHWLSRRDLPIPAARAPKMAAGLTLLDGEIRSPLFVGFMRSRAQAECAEVSKELLTLLAERLDTLAANHDFRAIVALPSETWKQRAWLASWIAERLEVPVHLDLLVWDAKRDARQGELLNNDQRRENVKGKMSIAGPVPAGTTLLLDDYHGSLSTLREAGRTMRKEGGFEHELVPLTVARVRWRLGAPGMI